MRDVFADGLFEERINDPGDDGIHRAYVTICTTPGWLNLNGEHVPDTVENHAKTKFQAFQSVALFLEKEPSFEQLAFIKARALAFQTAPKQHKWDSKPGITGFRLLRKRVAWASTVV